MFPWSGSTQAMKVILDDQHPWHDKWGPRMLCVLLRVTVPRRAPVDPGANKDGRAITDLAKIFRDGESEGDETIPVSDLPDDMDGLPPILSPRP